jgi:hypothetical protein
MASTALASLQAVPVKYQHSRNLLDQCMAECLPATTIGFQANMKDFSE